MNDEVNHNANFLKATLTNGATISSISSHSFKFSDGSELAGQPAELVSQFDIERKVTKVGEVVEMPLYRQGFKLTNYQLTYLKILSQEVDLLIVPVMLLDALRFMDERDNFPNLVAFNATNETQRSAPADKIVDIENWSY
jgi:hypothetical protein